MADNVTRQEQIVTNLPDYAEPYFTRLMGEVEAFGSKPYEFYQGQRFSEINPLQRQAMEAATNLRPSEQLVGATNMAQQAGLGALDSKMFDQAAADQYMSPYMRNVMEVQKQSAMRDYQRELPMLQAQGAKFGALGGSRAALARSEASRNMQNSLQGIEATGLQNAYQQAMAQFNADQQRRMQGYSTAIQGANTMGTLGATDFEQRMNSMNAQRQAGTDLYGLEQQQKDFDYNQFVEAQNMPYKQFGLRSDVLRGAPAGNTTSTVYGGAGNNAASFAGNAFGAYNLYKAGTGT